MRGKIIVGADDRIKFDDPNKRNVVSVVSIKNLEVYGNGKIRILIVDCGVKHSIIRAFLKRNVQVIRIPWNYNFSELDYDGLIISNGPGDPKLCKETIRNIRWAIEDEKPIMGICLGNQILALAAGADTYKLKYGHRSQNQPCIMKRTKKCFITSQNHGYAVKTNSLPAQWQEWFINANDKTNEGIIHKSKPFFAIQFHPEANPGPQDTEFLFDEFLNMIKK
jgi:carbamoyl-phosphate synthase small subunit